MGKVGRVIGAYAIATGTAGLAGVVSADLLRGLWWPGLDTWQAVEAFWLVVVGSPSTLAAWNYLSQTLGAKPSIQINFGQQRSITVAGAMADAAVSVLGKLAGRPANLLETAHLDIAEALTIRQGATIVEEPEIKRFLAGAYSRQLCGDKPFSRTYWVEGRPRRIDRQRYDITIQALLAHNLLTGERRQGATVYMRYTPGMTLAHLKHYYGPLLNRRRDG